MRLLRTWLATVTLVLGLVLMWLGTQAATVITSGSSLFPSGLTVLYDGTGGCPIGWVELTAMRGMYPRGMLAAGETIATSVGTALTANENRATGQHAHTQQLWTTSTGGTQPLVAAGNAPSTGAFAWPGSLTTANAGSVAGTNAPYYLVQFCKKS